MVKNAAKCATKCVTFYNMTKIPAMNRVLKQLENVVIPALASAAKNAHCYAEFVTKMK
jgi:hypothetical protein